MGLTIVGIPGSGKGTQSLLLSEFLGYSHLSTGDILREAANQDTDQGRDIKSIIDQGHFVSSDLITKLVQEKIGSTESPFVLDGFPRTIDQAWYVMNNLKQFPLDLVIHLRCSEQTSIQRLLDRRVCKVCGANSKGACILHPTARLVKRPDDSLRTINKRLKIFSEITKPIITELKKKYPVLTVCTEKSGADVFSEIKAVVKNIDTYI